MSSLVQKLNELLAIPDPPHGLLLNGIYEAADWIRALAGKDRATVISYFQSVLSVPGQSPQKIEVGMVLQLVGGDDSIRLLEKVLAEGVAVHGSYMIATAEHALKKIREAQQPPSI